MTASLGNLNYYAFPTRDAVIAAGILTEKELTSAYGPIDFSAVYPSGFSCTGEAGCTAYSLLYRNVPSEFCATIIPKVVERSSRIRVNGSSNVVLKGTPIPEEPGPQIEYDPGKMVAACNSKDKVLVALIADK